MAQQMIPCLFYQAMSKILVTKHGQHLLVLTSVQSVQVCKVTDKPMKHELS